MRQQLTACLLFLLGLSLPGAALGQRTTANVFGTVQDGSGAVIPLVTVMFTNELTGAVHSAVTNSTGEFTAAFLPVGTYTVVVEAPGFKLLRETGLQLTSGQQVRYPISLAVGEVSEKV